MAKILGVDPGKATGLAIFDTQTLEIVRMDETPHGIRGFKEPFKAIVESPMLGVHHLVFENFTLRSSNKFTADLSGVEIIGWLKGECYWGKHNPEPSQHMGLTRLRQKKDNYAESKVTKLMKAQGYRIGKGHTRMALSVAMWYAAMVLKDRTVLEYLKPREDKN